MDFDPGEAYDRLYRYCYFKLRHIQTAEDITQEAFLRYYRHRESFGRTEPLAYLYTIAKNLCADYYRSPQAQPLLEEPEDRAAAAQMEASLAVKAAVHSLPENLQELVLLRYANDLKLGEIAHITGQSRFALRRKLQKAMQHLKKLLEEETK